MAVEEEVSPALRPEVVMWVEEPEGVCLKSSLGSWKLRRGLAVCFVTYKVS